jgi:hypothetical protein
MFGQDFGIILNVDGKSTAQFGPLGIHPNQVRTDSEMGLGLDIEPANNLP